MNSNIKENFAIAEDGTIKRVSNELDVAMLNIIRVGANKDDILAAYKARKKCYQICKKVAKRLDYREYVETLQLDNFPNELKKADYGERYVNIFRWLIICVIIGISCLGFGLYVLYEYHSDFEILLGLAFVSVAVGLYFIVSRFFVKKLSSISQSIKSIKSV
ncbi:MAG: hypothetical protein IJ816_01085 [Alloprevotella sp.]|nr:hypothetical protein [Alloprevotella sp.]